MDEWTEEDGTIYRKNANGDYDIISPTKKATKAKKPKKTSKKE